MDPKSMEFIYKALNAIASCKFDADTEEQLADAIDQELLARNACAAMEPAAAMTA